MLKIKTMENRDTNVLVIVPAFNEEETIAAVIDDLRSRCPDFEIVVINDGSSDQTAHVARKQGVRVIDLKNNLGIGGAMQTGFIYAARKGYSVVVQCDGDGQHPAEAVAEVVKTLKSSGKNMVIGSRFIARGKFSSSFWRQLGIILLSQALSIFCRQRITDPTSGLRACDHNLIDFFSRNYPQDFPEPESLFLLKRNGFSFLETKVEMNPRLGGKSSLRGVISLLYMAKVILAILIEAFRPSGR